MADKAFERVHGWFVQAVDRSLEDVADAGQRDALRKILWSLADPVNRNLAPPAADPTAFNQPNISGNSLAIAAIVVGESIVAIDPLKKLVDAIDAGSFGDAKAAVSSLIDQIRRAAGGARVYPSAFGLGKLLLTLSRDVEGPAPVGNVARAQKLAALVSSTPAGQLRTSSTIGVQTMLLGAVLDKAFADDPAAQIKGFVDFGGGALAGALPPLPNPFPLADLPSPGASGNLAISDFDPLKGVRFVLTTELEKEHVDGSRKTVLDLKAQGGVQVRWDGTPPVVGEDGANPLALSLDVALVKASGEFGAISLPPPDGDPIVRLQIDELGASLMLAKPAGGAQLAPSVGLRLKGGKIVIKIDDALISKVLGDRIDIEFDIEALADSAGGLRLKDGSGLRVNLPVKKLPTGPFKLELISFGIEPKNSFAQIETELSISAAVDLGPFKASVERIGMLLVITVADGETQFKFKPPTGLGLSLDVGPIKGGGFLSFDPELGEYRGALEIKILSVGVKALGMLNTKRPGGNWSLLLLIFGNFPPIQLSWGFVLSGVGGLVGVQHSADTSAMASQLSSGGLDAVLFPKDVAGNAPQIFNTLSTLFPFKQGGFVIGPMIEVGWGTPELVTVRMGVLIEASQIAILGQVIIQVPPLVDKQLAILYLQLDFVGVIVFDPFKIAFDARLRDSRVAFISITGQFAFRAAFGDKPTFLISAGGFHPRFADIPPDIPMPFDRIGAGFSIGIVGVSVKGYFAITAATVQNGFEMKAWGDVGVASFDAGFGYDAICYLQPKFYFEVDFRAWACAQAFGIEFGIRLAGLLKGPGRWRIRGEAEIDLGWFGSVSIDVDESFGEDTDTPLVTENGFALLTTEAGLRDNWAVQLPPGNESFVSLRDRKGDKEPLAHPMASLVFTQRKLPLKRLLDKIGEAKVEGPRQMEIAGTTFNELPTGSARSAQREQFSASQFFKMSDDDRLGKPSFESMEAGASFHFDEFEFGVPVQVAPVDWETRNLDPQPGFLLDLIVSPSVLEATLSGHHLSQQSPTNAQWMFETGAVARGAMRAQERLLPADATPLAIKPAPPGAVTGKARQESVLAQPQDGVWGTSQALTRAAAGSAVAAQQMQVVELFELDAVS